MGSICLSLDNVTNNILMRKGKEEEEEEKEEEDADLKEGRKRRGGRKAGR